MYITLDLSTFLLWYEGKQRAGQFLALRLGLPGKGERLVLKADWFVFMR
jgi:hypothetical protein